MAKYVNPFTDMGKGAKELEGCETLFDKWIYVLKYMENWDRMPEGLKEQVFERLARLAEVANLSEADRILTIRPWTNTTLRKPSATTSTWLAWKPAVRKDWRKVWRRER